MLNYYIDPTFLHTYTKTQPTATSILSYCQICARNIYAHKFSIYTIHIKYLVDLYRICIPIYVPHTKSLPSTIEQWVLYIYLSFNCTNTAVTLKNICYTPNMLNEHTDLTFLYTCAKIHMTASSCFTCYCQMCARNKNAHQIRHICHICKLFDWHTWEMYELYMKSLALTRWPWALYLLTAWTAFGYRVK